MARLRFWLSRFRSLWRAEEIRREIAEEMRFHIEQRTTDNMRRGTPAEQSRRDAERSFGALVQMSEEGYNVRSVRWLEAFLQDAAYGIRLLYRAPGFAAAAVLTLALGIGANTAIFSVVDSVLLRPLPYPDSGRLVVMGERVPQMEMSVAYVNFRDWEKQNNVFESIGARRYTNFNMTGTSDPVRVRALMASAGYLPTLGVKPILGRLFSYEEDRDAGAPVVVLSYGFWKQHFGSDPNITSKTIVLDNRNYAIVGVLPPDFAPGTTAQFYVPLATMSDPMKTRDNHPGIYVVGRLKPGVTMQQAQSEMARIAASLAKEFPLTNDQHEVTMTPMRDWVVGDAREPLWIILAAVGVLLLIACVNVSNLSLARAAARQREISVRMALGASRGRLIGQMLTESALVSLGGGVIGLGLAYLGLQALVALKPGNLPRLAEIGINIQVLGFTVTLSVLTAILFGIAPALRASDTGISDSLKDTGTRASGGREPHRMRRFLVVTEVALSVVLLIAAGLLVRSFAKLMGVSPSFDPHKLLTFTVDLPGEYAGYKRIDFFNELKRRIEAQPEVQAAAYATGLPLIGTSESSFRLPSQSKLEGFEAVEYDVGPDYFKSMRIRLLKGRLFAESDRGGPLVTVVDEVLERKCFNGDAVKKYIVRDPLPPIQVIGVVDHVANYALAGAEPVGPQYYFSLAQIPPVYLNESTRHMAVVVRTKGDPAVLADTMRKLVSSMDPRQPIGAVETMDKAVAESVAPLRFSTFLLGLFSLVALLLASVGIYGVIAYSVSQRTNEIGIRIALGARTGDVIKMIFWQGAQLLVLGIVLGVAVSLVATRALTSQLYAVKASDPGTFAGIAALMTAVALLAMYFPARRATKVDPLIALRRE